MSLVVKICGLRKADDVKAAVSAGADAVGFVFADSVRRVEPARAATLAHSVPDTVKKVAVMLHPSNEEWQRVMQAFSPDVLQTDAEDFAGLDIPSGIDTWPVYRERNKVTDTLISGAAVPFFVALCGCRSSS